MQELDLLILGAGWSSTFLIPLLRSRHLPFAATTRDGRDVAGSSTIKWTFDPTASSSSSSLTTSEPNNQFSSLPLAKHILITFPLTSADQSRTLVNGYNAVHSSKNPHIRFIQFGSTGIWQIPQRTLWVSRRSPYDTSNARAQAEDELLRLDGCVLNLAGLWGGPRDPSQWVDRVARSKEDVKGKKSLHMVHGADVARALLAVVEAGDKGWEEKARGQRWMLTDGFVYDWWSLMAGWADAKNAELEKEGKVDRVPSMQAQWVYELMREEKVWALPRSMEALGRCYFGREFWDAFGIVPLKARI